CVLFLCHKIKTLTRWMSNFQGSLQQGGFFMSIPKRFPNSVNQGLEVAYPSNFNCRWATTEFISMSTDKPF
ncbi:hypothetical protein, partial [Vibrio cholerae]|uniref:hypothetical protein n=1 Tax=Vibrio cholerae TaxID=666 RepID=UPI001CA31E6D